MRVDARDEIKDLRYRLMNDFLRFLGPAAEEKDLPERE